MRRPVVLLATALALLSAPCKAAGLLELLDGRWSGGGWAVPKPGAAREAVRCRIRAAVSAGGTRVDVTGQCASPGNRSAVNGYLVRAPDGSYSGRWSNPRGLGTIGLTGTGAGNRVILSFEATHPDTGQPVSGTMEWRVSETAFTISGTTRDAGSARAEPSGMLTFNR